MAGRARRVGSVLCAALACGGWLAVATAAQAAAPSRAPAVGVRPGDWPQPGHGPRQQSDNHVEDAIDVGNAGHLTKQWTYRAQSNFAPEQVIDADGSVYVSVFFFGGSRTGALVALDPSTGAVRWQVPVPPFSDVRAVDGVLVVRYAGTPGGLIGLDPADGTTLWQLRTHAFVSQALVGLHRVFMVYEPKALGPATIDAVDPSDGRVEWTRKLGARGSSASIGMDDQFVYAAVGYQSVTPYALDARTGAVHWIGPTVAGVYATGVVVSDRTVAVLVQPGDDSSYPEIEAFRQQDGAFAWSALPESDHDHVPTGAFENGTIDVRDQDTGDVTAFDIDSGTRRWSFTGPGGADAAIANGVLFVCEYGGLSTYDNATGTRLATYRFGATDFLNDVIVAHGSAIVAAEQSVTSYAPAAGSASG